MDGGYGAMRKLMEEPRGSEALIITGDRVSPGSLKALRELKLNVPRDVGVLAMDGQVSICGFFPPRDVEDLATLERR
jgi:DNA-binding LacI/PurR family transcriptional regulator